MHPPNRLYDLRHAADLSQREVAARIGVTRTTVGRMEARQIPIVDKHKAALAALFGVSRAHLMAWDEEAAA